MGGSGAEFGGMLPKPLAGVLRAEWVRCGNRGCRCRRGQPHGPYWYRRWREDGQQRKAYVRPEALSGTLDGLALARMLRPRTWPARRLLAELRALETEGGR